MTRTVEDMYPPTVGNGAPDIKRSLLVPAHTAAAAANVNIAHAQLRHLISCPSQRGIVYYVGGKSILERDVLKPTSPPRCVIDIEFSPTCFTATAVSSNPTTILFAAGGYNSDIHLSLHAFPSTPQTPSSSSNPSPASPRLIWRHSHRLRGRCEIVNFILFTPASMTDDTLRSPSDVRMAVSGNDAAVKMFEVAMEPNARDEQRLQDCGSIKLETPVNHLSLSPDGRTLLCVGDTPKAYLFNISPGSTVTFSPLAVYTLPPPPRTIMDHGPPSPTSPPPNFGSQACFSTAWSADGLKFAVASQEGQLCVWDVRSAHPVLTLWTPFRRNWWLVAADARGRMGEWEWEDLVGQLRPVDDATNNGPDSGIRNVRFSAGDGGRELLVFTEHTFNVHVLDARTFDLASHSVMRFPDLCFPLSSPSSMAPTEPRTPSPVTGIRVERRQLPERRSPIIVPGSRARSRSRTRSPVNFPRSRSRSGSRTRTPLLTEDRNSPRSRSQTPPNVIEPRRMRSRSPRSPSRPIVIGRRSRSHSPVIIVPAQTSQSPPGVNWPVVVRDEQNVLRPPNIVDVRESRARLDADGDVIQGDVRPAGLLQGGWTGRVSAPPNMMRSRTARSEGGMLLEAVAEGGEPPPPQKPIHLAGMCFDPSGGWVYVASESCIVEWRVREREEGKTCWGSGAWA